MMLEFTEDERAALAADAVALPDGSTPDAATLAVAWAKHVSKLDADRALPYTDRSVWTEHDLAGSLFLRDNLERALTALRPALRERLADDVRAADEQFRSFTVEDSGRKIGFIAGVDVAGRGWWWFRVPKDGPIVQDLASY
ncbi:hypothetical protein EV186_1031065 [Labedaea rhizosphaerae]|uniref:Uncharacterized protein n=2 Tax=Labedaea rhizosphaerae TaxID=598644 RepID=A0A4R6SFW0_LABRH|nr:hypothetical protein EV186_1031065 [Labedaea rhizosphaerae]